MDGCATIIHPDGVRRTIHLRGAPPDYEALREWMNGGMLEAIGHFSTFEGAPCHAFCDEEGKLKHLAYNNYATQLWYAQVGRIDDVLVGPVIILSGDQEFLDAC